MRLKNFAKTSIIVIIVIALLYAGSVFLSSGILLLSQNNESYSMAMQLNNKFVYSTENDIFIDDEEYLEDSVKIMESVYSKLPSHIANVIKNEWSIVVSLDEPIKTNSQVVAAGVTYSNVSVIWLSRYFDETVMSHEIGHAIDSYLGHPSLSSEFDNIYNKYWNEYLEFGAERINKHSTSDSSEFFAALFADYIVYPDYLKEQAPDAYAYFERILINDWRFSDTGKYLSLCSSTNQRFKSVFDEIATTIKLHLTSTVDVKKVDVTNNALIDIDDYTETHDLSWLSKAPREVVEIMLDLAQNPDKYPKETHRILKSEGYVIEYDFAWPISYYQEVLSFATMYYGDEDLDPIDVNVINGVKTEVVIKHDIVVEAEALRINSLKNVEDVLKTIHDGTETEILIQISNYIIDNSTYVLQHSTNFYSFWGNHEGDCVMYTMIFKQFLDRLGYENDIVSVVYSNGMGHVYNRVLIDGQYRYYDLTNKIVDANQIDKTGYHINTWQIS